MNSSKALSLYKARKLLGLESTSPLTKARIQEAFVEAAKLYHPDSRHKQPCAVKFRECHQPRRLSLDHYCSGGQSRPTTSTTNNATANKPWYKPSDPRKHGFPYTTLRVLTLRQNLALRGMVMLTLAVGAICDKYIFS